MGVGVVGVLDLVVDVNGQVNAYDEGQATQLVGYGLSHRTDPSGAAARARIIQV